MDNIISVVVHSLDINDPKGENLINASAIKTTKLTLTAR